ncbi:MAG TPA: GxxExxY protein [Pyrinomonadaceae bacterium]|nr:GxxExxY protein [Pyrinomonadaceae bacterium]
MTENEIATIVVDAAFKIHKTLGPGLFESVYEAALRYELQKRGLMVVQQRGIPVRYDGLNLGFGFRVDLLVNNKVILEVKSVEALAAVHKMQLTTYLRLMDLRLGLLINFNVELIRNGIRRVVNQFVE